MYIWGDLHIWGDPCRSPAPCVQQVCYFGWNGWKGWKFALSGWNLILFHSLFPIYICFIFPNLVSACDFLVYNDMISYFECKMKIQKCRKSSFYISPSPVHNTLNEMIILKQFTLVPGGNMGVLSLPV